MGDLVSFLAITLAMSKIFQIAALFLRLLLFCTIYPNFSYGTNVQILSYDIVDVKFMLHIFSSNRASTLSANARCDQRRVVTCDPPNLSHFNMSDSKNYKSSDRPLNNVRFQSRTNHARARLQGRTNNQARKDRSERVNNRNACKYKILRVLHSL